MASNSGFGHSNPVFDRNPAFTRTAHGAQQIPVPSAEQLQGMYDAPSARTEPRMTLDDVVVKCALTFGALLIVAGSIFFLFPQLAPVAMIGGLVVGLVLGLIIAFKQSTNPALIMTFAVAEGALLGGISRVYENAFGPGLVSQAILGTLAATVGMLVLFSTGKLRATPKFTKMLMTAAFAYLAVALLNLVLRLFGVTEGFGFYGMGFAGILLCVAGVAIASFFLILDFDFIQRGIENGAPARYSWLAAAGLMMTLVWLYLEILRLLAVLRGE